MNDSIKYFLHNNYIKYPPPHPTPPHPTPTQNKIEMKFQNQSIYKDSTLVNLVKLDQSINNAHQEILHQ